MKTVRQTSVVLSPVLLTLLLALLAWPSVLLAGNPNSGLDGQVLLHDSRVINIFTGQVGITAPFQASLRVYSLNSNRLVTSFTTTAGGRFQVHLPPGSYRLVPDTMWQGRALLPGEIVLGPYAAALPINLRVWPHRFSPLTITYEQMMGF